MIRLCNIAGCAALLVLAGCGKDAAAFGPEATHPTAGRPIVPGQSTRDRFGLGQMPGAAHGTAGPAAGATAMAPAYAAPTPEGWTARPSRTMRDLDWQVGDAALSAECYLTTGLFGSVQENADRWRGQFGMPAMPVGEPGHTLLERPAVLVEAAGSFGGKEGQALLGLIAQKPDGGIVTLKMTGPQATVAAERERFLQLAPAIRPATPGAAAAAPTHGQGSSQGAGAEPPGDDLGHGEDQGLQVGVAPPGWRLQPKTGFRLFDYRIGEATECAVTVLGGDGGGLRETADRWRRECGLPPLGEAELQALPKVPMLGGEGVLIEAQGDYKNAMTGQNVPGALLLGVVATRPQGTLFLKLVGPLAEATVQRQALLQFCDGLRWQEAR